MMMMMTEMVLETSVKYTHLMRPIARKDFIEFSRHEISKSYSGLRSEPINLPENLQSRSIVQSEKQGGITVYLPETERERQNIQ
jgi:hypothetical protein